MSLSVLSSAIFRREANDHMKFLLQIIFLLFISVGHANASKIQGRLNIINGASAECVMHKFYTNSGWAQIEGEVGRNGIDGLYYKKRSGVIREVLVAESKWNKSRLGRSGKHKLIKQMSQEWVIKTLKRLQKYKPIPEYATILKLIKNGQYRARLFRMFPRSGNRVQIQIYRIKNKGSNDYDIKIEQKLESITMGKPKNSFQAMLLNAYNNCRKTYLHKYLPELTDRQIKLLLQDNYIQPKDIHSAY